MSIVIKTVNLTKRYGTLVALSNLNLEISAGDCFGFIGPNGAGKTTTIKILATLLQPTWGEARICDYVVGYQSRQIRPLIGYVPDYFGAYPDMLVQEYMEFFAAAYNINGPQRTKLVAEILEFTDLAYKMDSPVDGLSRGMKQRLSIARTLLHDPKVLLLDEPAGNLDPRARIEMRELLKELRRRGKTIIISSHILPELADMCNTVGIIERGELKYSGPVSEILARTRAGTVIHVGVGGGSERLEKASKLLAELPEVASAEIEAEHINVRLAEGLSDWSFLAPRLLSGGFQLRLLKEQEVNLETAFMRFTQGMVQ